LAWAFGRVGERAGLVGTLSGGRLLPQWLAGRDASGIGLYGTAARGPWVVSGRTALRWSGSVWQAYRLPVSASAVGGEGANVWTVSAAGYPAQPATDQDDARPQPTISQDGERPEPTTSSDDTRPRSTTSVDDARSQPTTSLDDARSQPAASWNGARPQPAARWNGSAWQVVHVPELGLPLHASSPRAHLDDVAVLGVDDVWAVGGVSWLAPGKTDRLGEPLEVVRPVALHWDGGGWRCLWGAPGTTFTQAEPDGRGGVWVLDSTGSRLLHHSGGRWTSTKVAGTVTALSHRPGTDEVYAAGSVPQDGDLTRATLWRNR
ncbi:hypothetical protein, partial [Nonomuraea zeae]